PAHSLQVRRAHRCVPQRRERLRRLFALDLDFRALALPRAGFFLAAFMERATRRVLGFARLAAFAFRATIFAFGAAFFLALGAAFFFALAAAALAGIGAAAGAGFGRAPAGLGGAGGWMITSVTVVSPMMGA